MFHSRILLETRDQKIAQKQVLIVHCLEEVVAMVIGTEATMKIYYSPKDARLEWDKAN